MRAAGLAGEAGELQRVRVGDLEHEAREAVRVR